MRTPNVDIRPVHTTGMVSFACPRPVVGVKGLLPVSAVAVVEVPQWDTARLRPSLRQRAALSRITATGVGYGFTGDPATGMPGAERRNANGTTARSIQSKQLHLMSRRDPQTWRPPV